VAAMVIEVPQELKALGDAMVEAMAAVAKARAGTAAGKAVDYAAVEVAIGEAVTQIERAGLCLPRTPSARNGLSGCVLGG
jgi:hypothetical protein